MSVLALSALTLSSVQVSRQVDWYRFRPTAWVIDDLASPSNTVASRAWNELLRRDNAGGFSRRNAERIASIALAEQCAATPGPLAESMTDWLGRQALDGRLNEPDKRRFFQQLLRLQFRLRPVVTLGDPLPYVLRMQPRTPTGAHWWVRARQYAVKIDGKGTPQSSGGSISMTGFVNSVVWNPSVQCDGPGHHVLTLIERLEILYGAPPTDEDESRKKLDERDVAFSGAFTVSANANAGGVRPVRDPAVREKLLATLKPTHLQYSPSLRELSCTLQMNNLPIDIALDVYVRSGGKEYCAGGISELRGTSGHSDPSCAGVDYDGSTDVEVVLRPNLKAARESLDIVQIWDGEPLVFQHIPLQMGKPAVTK